MKFRIHFEGEETPREVEVFSFRSMKLAPAGLVYVEEPIIEDYDMIQNIDGSWRAIPCR